MDKLPEELSKAATEVRERLKSRLDEDDVDLFRTMAVKCSQQMMSELTGISRSDISHVCNMYDIKPFQIRKGGVKDINSILIARTMRNMVRDHGPRLTKLKAKFPSRSV